MGIIWEVQLLGGLQVKRPGQCITHFRTRATGALLAYLASHGGTAQPREVLIDLLWSEATLDSGRHSLSMALSFLRRSLEPSGIAPGTVVIANRQSVTLNTDKLSTDVALFERAFLTAKSMTNEKRHSAFLTVIDLYRGELLPSQNEDWVWRERTRLADMFFQVVRQVIDTYRENGERGPAQELARMCITRAPDREEGYAHLIRLLLAEGLVAEATRHYRHLQKVLATDGLSPSPALTRLLGVQRGKTQPLDCREF